MLVKVCGLKYPEQVEQISVRADFIGFIYYPKSKRYVTSAPVSSGAKRVGVFVDEKLSVIREHIRKHQLDYVQLHGNETPETCRILKNEIGVIKALGISNAFNFEQLSSYSTSVDYFLFDTKTHQHGGSGKSFDWNVLKDYKLDIPFFLSGGIRADSLTELTKFNHPLWVGVDLNSGFELAPANKDLKALNTFLDELNKIELHMSR